MLLDKKIGITGARGFIGSNLCDYLTEQKISYECFTGNLLNEEDIIKYFSQHQIEEIIHLVGTFEPPFENQLKLNVLTTQKLLEVGVKRGLKRIIFVSTGAVYGESATKGSVETDDLKPNTLYGLSKMWAEDCIKYYANNFNLNYIILRFSNVYGPGNTKGIIYNFLKSIKENNRAVIFGTGEQKRNFLFVDDAVEAIGSALKHKGNNEIFNIADEELYSLNDLVKLLKNMGLNFTVNRELAEESNSLQVLSENIQKAKKLMNWQPKINLEQGIEKLIR